MLSSSHCFRFLICPVGFTVSASQCISSRAMVTSVVASSFPLFRFCVCEPLFSSVHVGSWNRVLDAGCCNCTHIVLLGTHILSPFSVLFYVDCCLLPSGLHLYSQLIWYFVCLPLFSGVCCIAVNFHTTAMFCDSCDLLLDAPVYTIDDDTLCSCLVL